MVEYTGLGRAGDLVCEAVVWLNEGVSVVPAQPNSKAVHLSWRRFEKEYPSYKLLRNWFASGTMNLAVVCGTGGLLVLDFDNLDQFEAWKSKAGELLDTYTEFTGRGVHLFYKVDLPVTRRFIECEALGLGHLCLAAPSIHPNGAIYKSPDVLTPIRKVETAKLFSLLSDPLPVVKPGVDRESLQKANNPVVTGRDLLSRIKAAFPLLSYAESLTELKPSGGHGQWFIGKCPLHDDHDPSFWLDARRQIWRCFSPGCKGSSGGDVLNLYALANNTTVDDAIRRLAREAL